MNQPAAKSALPLFALLCVIIGGMWAYRDVGGFDYVNFDDPPLVTENPYVNRGLTADSLRWAFTFEESEGNRAEPMASELWAPLSFVSLALDVEIGGLDSSFQHRINLGLHLLSTALVFLFFHRLTGKIFVAWAVAAVFCFHPMRAESVVWISERKDVLSGFLVLCTLNLYLLWKGRGKGRALWWTALATFALACLAKPAAVVAPLLLLWVDAWLARGEKAASRPAILANIRSKAADFAVMIAMAGTTLFMKLAHAPSSGDGATSLGQRMLEIPMALLFYLERTVLPKYLFASYGRYPHPFWFASLIAVVVLVVVGVILWRTRKAYPEWLFGCLWFLIALLPMLGFAYVGPSFTADRYTYLAHCGIAFAVAHAMTRLAGRKREWRPILIVLTASYLVALAIWCHDTASAWKNSGTLFTQGVRAQPSSARNWNNLGAWLVGEGDARSGVHCLEQAIAIGGEPDAYFNLARHINSSGQRPSDAAELLRKCLAEDPDHGWAMIELGTLLTDPESGALHDLEAGRALIDKGTALTGGR